MYWILASIMGYFIGCIHGSQFAGFLTKKNLKESGVKNAGAANATIVLGWKYGALVAFIDIVKGIISVLITLVLFGTNLSNEMIMALLFVNAFFVVIGHNFPVQMRFNGGKGTASVVGVLLVLDWRIGLISIILLLSVTYLTDYLVIGVTVMYASFLVCTYIFELGWIPVSIVALLWIISSFKHIENFIRLKNNEETRLSSLIKKKAS